MFGHFAVFDRWTEIDSFWEGHFLERIARGAFKKTFRELGRRIKPLFQHGMDPQVGDKPLGPAETLREDETGAYYEVPLLDTSYNRDLIPGLEAGLYGASFRFSVMREEWVEEPGQSEHNPAGLPERTLKELRVPEFGPVTFPAYEEATAGIRSLTDEFIIGRATRDPDRLRALLTYLEQRDARSVAAEPNPSDEPASEPGPTDSAPPQDRAETQQSHSDPGRRRDKPTSLYGLSPKEKTWRL
jgi:HK97 family phage prohead protease